MYATNDASTNTYNSPKNSKRTNLFNSHTSKSILAVYAPYMYIYMHHGEHATTENGQDGAVRLR